jgi:LCP family protein required for cell wall assembly
VLGTAFVALLSLAVLAPSAFAARYALIQRDVVQSVFGGSAGGGTQAAARGAVAAPGTTSDPWKDTPRVNVLLLGSDAGADRTGVRTDSMIVASIDTRTGRTVLLGLPRSLQKVPFPASNPLHQIWPNGFDCGDQCLLNAVWEQAEQHKDLFKGDPHPGLTTIRAVIGEILGVRIDYYTILDLAGFSGLIDAMGGVVVNVPREIPIGGGHNLRTGAPLPIYGYVHKGRHRLNGREALWFARSREGSDDYDRMRRQRCMVGALLDQSNPVRLLASYPRLAKVLKDNLQTDVPRSDLSAWVTLIERVQKGGIVSLPFTNDVINTVHPDFGKIRTYVQDALAPKPAATSSSSTSSSPSSSAKPKPRSGSGSAKKVRAESISATC